MNAILGGSGFLELLTSRLLCFEKMQEEIADLLRCSLLVYKIQLRLLDPNFCILQLS